MAGAAGQAPEEDGEVLELDTIVVIGEEVISERELENPTKFVTIIDVSDSTERVETAAEVLEEAVGVRVNRWGGMGGYATVSIRGSSAAQVQVYVDGVPMNRAASGVTNLEDLPLDSIEYIEVYRGFTPADFGAAGIGGVVNLVTRKANKQQASISASAGSFETYKVVAMGSGPAGPVRILVLASYMESKGDFEFENDNGTPAVGRDDFTDKRTNNQFESIDLTTRVSAELDAWEITAVGSAHVKDQGLPGISAAQAQQTSLSTERYTISTSIRRRDLMEGKLDLTLGADYIKDYQTYDDPLGELGVGGARKNENRMHTMGGRIKSVWRPLDRRDRLIVTGYLEYREETFLAVDYVPSVIEGKEQERSLLSAVLQAEAADPTGAFSTQATIRYQRYWNRIQGDPYFAWSTAAGDNNDIEDYWSPSIGARWRVNEALVFKANAGRFYRVPTFLELFGDRGVTVGNTDLRPEEGINYDVGFILSADAIGGLDRPYLQYAFFQSRVDDLIVFFQNSQRTLRATNIGEAVISGHELSFSAGLTESLRLSGAYTFQAPVDKGEVPHWRDNQLPLRSMHEAFIKFDYAPLPGLKTWTDYTYISGAYWDRANIFEVDDRHIYNAGVTVGLYKSGDRAVLATFEGKNLADDRIADVAGYPLPGTSYYGTIQARW